MADKPIELPLWVRKNLGVKPWQPIMICPAALPFIGEIAGPTGPLSAHPMTLIAPLLIGISMVALYVFGRNPSELTIDQTGVTYVSRRSRLFVAWADVDRITTLEVNVRVELKGRPEKEGVMIPGAFLKRAATLSGALRAGFARWGGQASGQTHSQLPPGARRDLAAQGSRRFRKIFMTTYPITVGVVVIVVAASLGLPALNDSRIKAHGVRAQATVVRIYSGACGRSVCRRRLEYAYKASDGRTLYGFSDIGSEGDTNADYVYARTHSTLPIAIDAANPSISDLNIGDSAFRNETSGFMLIITGLLCLAIVASSSLIAFFLLRTLRKAERVTLTKSRP
ncbi:MAG TPA: hypothetical protein VGG92_01270 [Caulobacteraceae bacterium]